MMKNLFYILGAVIFLFVQCKTDKNTEKTSTTSTITFKGKIADATQPIVYVSSSYERTKAELKDGAFELEIPINEPVMVNFRYRGNEWTAFAKPGETIEMEFKEATFDSTFTISKYVEEGKLAAELKLALEQPRRHYSKYYALSEAAFIKSIDSLSMSNVSKIMRFSTSNPGEKLDPLFKSWLNSIVIYGAAENLEVYPNYHKRVSSNENYVMGEEMAKVRNKIKKERVNLLGNSAYSSYLQSKLNNRATDIYNALTEEEQTDQAYYDAQIKAIGENFQTDELKEYLNFIAISDQLAFIGVNSVQEVLPNFLAKTKSPIYKARLNESFSKWEHLQAGMTAPGFAYPDIEGVLHALGDYKGKFVYIDVWATWCGPCLKEQPALAEIEEHYKDNDKIVFMGVSIDTDKAAWEKMLKDKKLKGVQLLATNGFNSDLNKAYNISGIPRFILVDQNGNLINASAGRPSSKALQQQLAALLEGDALEGD